MWFNWLVFASVMAAWPILGAVLQRVPNSTLAMPASPPTSGFASTPAFPGLVFTNPVCLAYPPGETNRLFIVEKRGRVIVITNLAAPTRTVFLDITAKVTTSTSDSIADERGLLGLAFHPGYATNRYFYLFYTGNSSSAAGSGLHDRLSRFVATAANANLALSSSEENLINQYDQANNHNGGDLHFGPDGCLYVSLGDEGDANDTRNNSQRIAKDFYAGILRIDVDKRPGSLAPNSHAAATTNYAVPPDNPWVGATNFNGSTVDSNAVRTEFWAVGLRNPWRMSFDSFTGALYCGDVGQGTREEIDIIVRGGNYGWNYWEGLLQRTNSTPGAFVHAPPLIDYPRSQGYSVTGGRVYRGPRLAQLFGAYVYADYGSGNVWALRHDGASVTQNTLLFQDPGISAFGEDPSNGDLLYCDLASATNSTVDRIIYSGSVTSALPATLAATGAFADLATLQPAAGVVQYDLNAPFWSDHALKTRWFSVPNTNLTIGYNETDNWAFPTGTVWVKHFELELTNGVPESRHRLETRLLVRTTNGVYGATYRWGTATNNATLVAEAGMDEAFVIHDGGQTRTQVWHYPSRSECLMCHTAGGGWALGFNTAQLNRDFDYGGPIENQLKALSDAGYFNRPVTNATSLRALVVVTNASASLEWRARSYLAANCAACHLPGGSALGNWDARFATPTLVAGLLDGPLANSFGNDSNRVIRPGSTAHSMIHQRILRRGPGQMPPIASSVVDTNAVKLMADWIAHLDTNLQSFAAWQIAYFGSTNLADAGPARDPDGDGSVNYLEYLLGFHPLQPDDGWRASVSLENGRVQLMVQQAANRAFEIEWTATPFIPSSWRRLEHPANRLFFPAQAGTVMVTDDIGGLPQKYYRVRMLEY